MLRVGRTVRVRNDKERVVTNENENENNAAAYNRTLVPSVEHYATIVLKELRRCYATVKHNFDGTVQYSKNFTIH